MLETKARIVNRALETERYILSTFPVLYLPFYKLDGASFASKDAGSHLCTVTGALWRPQGRWFDGINDVITLAASTTLDNLSALSIIAWINPTSIGESSQGTIICKATGATLAGGWVFRLKVTDTIQFGAGFTGGTNLSLIANNSLISYGVSQCVAATWDGSLTATNAHIYKDAVELTYQTTTNGVGARQNDIANVVRIGNEATTANTFDGTVSEIILYNRVSALPSIQNIYLATKWRYS